MNKQIASAALTLIGALAASQQVSSQRNSSKRRGSHIITDTAGYTKLHGKAPDGGQVNSWSGKFLAAKGKKPAAIKFIDGKGRLQGILTLQEVREMAVAGAEGLQMFIANGVTDGTTASQ